MLPIKNIRTFVIFLLLIPWFLKIYSTYLVSTEIYIDIGTVALFSLSFKQWNNAIRKYLPYN